LLPPSHSKFSRDILKWEHEKNNGDHRRNLQTLRQFLSLE